jgi:hypothetical protein
MDINKIIFIVRSLKEEAMTLGSGSIAGTKEAGDDPPVDLRKDKRRNWNPFFKDLARIQRRKPPKI